MNESRRASLPEDEGLAAQIKVDTTAIPDHVRDALAASTLDLIHSILATPGGREALDARIAAKKATRTAG